jgi:hypothetical protein
MELRLACLYGFLNEFACKIIYWIVVHVLDESRFNHTEEINKFYFFIILPVHFCRGEKLYVTKDKRTEKKKGKLCWILCIGIVAAVIILGILAACKYFMGFVRKLCNFFINCKEKIFQYQKKKLLRIL